MNEGRRPGLKWVREPGTATSREAETIKANQR